jgi:hypothetical protein
MSSSVHSTHMGWSMSERADSISNMRFVVSSPSAKLAPPGMLSPFVKLFRRVLSFALGFVSLVCDFRSGLRTDEEGGSIIDSDMCTSMKDMAGFWEPCERPEDGAPCMLRLKVGFLASLAASWYVFRCSGGFGGRDWRLGDILDAVCWPGTVESVVCQYY